MRVTKKLIEENPVKAAAQMAEKIKAEDPKAAAKEIAKARSKIQELKDLGSDLLPLESEANDIQKQIRDLDQKISRLAIALIPTTGTMPIMDMSVFDWRDDQGFPRLVPFPIESGTFRICLEYRRARWTRNSRTVSKTVPVLPKGMVDYTDVYKTLRGLREKNKGVEISAKFGGIIPQSVRDIIQGAKEVFQHLFIVAEVKDWKVSDTKARTIPRSLAGDPLLIGFDGRHYRLIAEFDTTTLEQLAADRARGRKPS